MITVLDTRSVLGGLGRRIVGSTDARGQGTLFELPELGPYLFVEDARGIVGRDMPPFGMHPHTGMLILSHVGGGGRWISRSNAAGSEHLAFGPGDAVLTFTGRGIAHEERTATDGTHELMQIIFRLPHAHHGDPAWVRLQPPQSEAAGVVRLVDEGALASAGLEARVWFGSWTDDASFQPDVPGTHDAGWAFVREGALQVGDQLVQAGQVAVWRGPVAPALQGEGAVEWYAGTGRGLDEPWAKLLGHNGFVLAADEAACADLLAVYAADPDRFGRD